MPLPLSENSLRTVSGAAVYFVAVMTAGVIFGSLRELALIPAFGRSGQVLEVPLMLVAIIVCARLSIRWFRVPPILSQRLGMGVISLALVLIAEAALSPWVRGGVREWVDSFGPMELGIAIVLWSAHALAPAALYFASSRTAGRIDD